MSASFNRVRLRGLAGALCIAGLSSSTMALPLCRAPDNLITNPGFESGVWAPGGKPAGWAFESWSGTALGTWDDTVTHSGRYSVRIDALNPDDARWQQPVLVPVNVPLYLAGWIKSERVAVADPGGSPGATISALGRWDQTAPTYGSTPWHKVDMSLFAEASSLVAAPRLGFWAGLATGRAWYDDLTLVPRVADVPHPRWKILLLIFAQTDALITDVNGVQRHVLGASSPAELEQTAEQARLFVERDIPALTSGNMLPTLTVRHAVTPMKSLSPLGGGFWPAPSDVSPELDPTFDSVIVVWDPRVKDAGTGESLWIGAGAGLTLPRGTGQTYTTMSIEYAGANGHRNVYKHEWGHSILWYFEALQRTPQPTVTNHAVESQYVNCRSGRHYVWLDETDVQPIPNSIYSNSAGFTHDYYSGTVARVEDPASCLGIGPQAWAWGGPVTHSGSEPAFTAAQRVRSLTKQVDALQSSQMLESRSARLLGTELRAANWALGASRKRVATASLHVFRGHVQTLLRKGHLLPQAAALLIEAATAAAGCIVEDDPPKGRGH